MATLDEAAAYLAGLINVERSPDYRRARLSLEPIRCLLERLGLPQVGLSVLHIAGSKGKGSTAVLAEGIVHGGCRLPPSHVHTHLMLVESEKPLTVRGKSEFIRPVTKDINKKTGKIICSYSVFFRHNFL